MKKRLMAFAVVLCLLLAMVPTASAASIVPVYYNSYTDLRDTHPDVTDWSSTCFVCSTAMILSTKGIPNSTPYDVWKACGGSYVWWNNVHNAFGVTSTSGSLSGSADSIKAQIIQLCHAHPEGVLLSGTTNKGTTHAVVGFVDANDNFFYHDPGSYNWNSRTVSTSSYFFSYYTQFDTYRVFNGGSTAQVSISWVNGTQTPYNTDFYTYVDAVANVSGVFGEAGITVWDPYDNIVAQKIETPNSSSKAKLPIWYNVTAETGSVLTPGVTYKYQIHVKFNGSYYYSPLYTITTTGSHTHTYSNDSDTTCNICGYTRVIEVKTTAMYRMYNPNSGEHFYTGSTVERDDLVRAGWKYEGIGWYAPTTGGDPVYRLYNPYAGEHHYTTSAAERDNLVSIGWKYEGVGWLTASSNQVPIYRVYNPNEFANNHHYTASLKERNYLISIGWQSEGIGWYGMEK